MRGCCPECGMHVEGGRYHGDCLRNVMKRQDRDSLENRLANIETRLTSIEQRILDVLGTEKKWK